MKEKSRKSSKPKIFVLFIMPFGKKSVTKEDGNKVTIDFDDRFEKIKSAILKLKKDLSINRVDSVNNPDINQKMYRMIFSADCVVADLTLQNPNVMYELGLRHTTQDKITIMYRDNDDKSKIPFDIQGFTILNLTSNNLSEFAKKVSEIIDDKDDRKDSPIRKELEIDYKKISDYKKEFDDYFNISESFVSIAKCLKSKDDYQGLKKHLNKYKKTMKNHLEYKCLEIFVTYKINKEKLSDLKDALNMIEKESPKNSTDHELLGLWASVTRKILNEINVTDTEYKKYLDKMNQATKRFFSLFKTPYSFSGNLLVKSKLISVESSNVTHEKVKEYISKTFLDEIKSMNEDFGKIDLDALPNDESSHIESTKKLFKIAINTIEDKDFVLDSKNFSEKLLFSNLSTTDVYRFANKKGGLND